MIELLSVMAILALIAGFSASGLRNLAQGDHLQRAVIGISSALEAARQTAIARGTYTWVGFHCGKDASLGQNAVVVAAFASKTGTRGAGFINGKDVQLLSRVLKFDAVTLQDAPPSGSAVTLPAVSSKSTPADSSFKPQSDDLPTAYKGMDFDWVVIFNPRGEAAVDQDTGMDEADAESLRRTEAIDFAVVPSKGAAPSSLEEKSAEAIRVNGLTGKVDVYRAEASGN